jgi:hypothetical protein
MTIKDLGNVARHGTFIRHGVIAGASQHFFSARYPDQVNTKFKRIPTIQRQRFFAWNYGL